MCICIYVYLYICAHIQRCTLLALLAYDMHDFAACSHYVRSCFICLWPEGASEWCAACRHFGTWRVRHELNVDYDYNELGIQTCLRYPTVTKPDWCSLSLSLEAGVLPLSISAALFLLTAVSKTTQWSLDSLNETHRLKIHSWFIVMLRIPPENLLWLIELFYLVIIIIINHWLTEPLQPQMHLQIDEYIIPPQIRHQPSTTTSVTEPLHPPAH